jgi:hypothetical protein
MGGLLSFTLGINLTTGQIEVLVTNAELIDWLRARGRFLMWGNNGLSRSIAYKSYRLGAVLNQRDVPHMGTNAISPMTSAKFRLTWSNFVRLLAML